MKTFCILEQGKTINHEITLKKKEIFTTSESDFYRLNWKNDNDPNAFITQKGILWSEGRSLLYESVPKNYEYYIFLDEDITFEIEDAAQTISRLLRKYRPIAATFHCEDRWTIDRMKYQLRFLPLTIQNLVLEREAFAIKCFDLCTHVFSSDFAELVFPVPYHGSGRSMHYAQWICSKIYPGKQICFGKIKVRNRWSEGHEDGLNDTKHGKVIVSQFNRDVRDGSFDEKEWRIKSVGRQNLMHSIIHKVDMVKRQINMKDLDRIYNTQAPDFAKRTAIQSKL